MRKDYISNRIVSFIKNTRLNIVSLLIGVFFVSFLTSGCVNPFSGKAPEANQNPEESVVEENEPSASVQVPSESEKNVEVDVIDDEKMTGIMSSYDVTTIGRSDPFMPYGEYKAYEEIERAAFAQANARNNEIARLKNLQGMAVREKDDISPYSFNLPVPPTSLASEDSAAAKITRTKVVGIMYNELSPSAIINVDDKDYLVRQGDKIIGQEYKVIKINKDWVTVSLGSNIYSAAIGELFSKDELDKSRNDLYNLKNRFGGRKS